MGRARRTPKKQSTRYSKSQLVRTSAEASLKGKKNDIGPPGTAYYHMAVTDSGILLAESFLTSLTSFKGLQGSTCGQRLGKPATKIKQ